MISNVTSLFELLVICIIKIFTNLNSHLYKMNIVVNNILFSARSYV